MLSFSFNAAMVSLCAAIVAAAASAAAVAAESSEEDFSDNNCEREAHLQGTVEMEVE